MRKSGGHLVRKENSTAGSTGGLVNKNSIYYVKGCFPQSGQFRVYYKFKIIVCIIVYYCCALHISCGFYQMSLIHLQSGLLPPFSLTSWHPQQSVCNRITSWHGRLGLHVLWFDLSTCTVLIKVPRLLIISLEEQRPKLRAQRGDPTGSGISAGAGSAVCSIRGGKKKKKTNFKLAKAELAVQCAMHDSPSCQSVTPVQNLLEIF